MNNDISRDLTSYDKVKIPTGRIEMAKTSETMPLFETKADAKAMECLGAMGCAQVNMQKGSVKKSVEEFMSDPFLAQTKMDFCDSLVEDEGYDIFTVENDTLTIDMPEGVEIKEDEMIEGIDFPLVFTKVVTE